jgi:hypothetical protein
MSGANTSSVPIGDFQDPAARLIEQIRALKPGETVTDRLSVDDRVLARVTDGIYRQPSSALRELISNSFDADATEVVIQTDAPRFDRIVIRDNGNGMSLDNLAYLLHHIGGSSKRTGKGKQLGTVSQSDTRRSPAGRKLIGKIGIGLFAVSQLTQHFHIITKRKGDPFRTSAVVVLKTHTEEGLADDVDGNVKFDPGSVAITLEPTTDLEAQGTEIILMNLRKSTKDILGSVDQWEAFNEFGTESDSEGRLDSIGKPLFHIGRVCPTNRDNFLEEPQLPWDEADNPVTRFDKLYDAVGSALGRTIGNPKLESALDNYLRMIWTISLAAPINYINQHPLSLTSEAGIGIFQLSNTKKGQVQELHINKGGSIADALGMESIHLDPLNNFQVFIDGVALRRPVRIDLDLKGDEKQRRLGHPIMFVGRCVSPLQQVEATRGGGALEFEAYFYWNTMIVPKENNGVLIRVNGASGTLFDETFLDYRVSELTRLKQIMAEVFVTKGLDPALNIDRESFNASHPHYQYLKEWVHRALRQATNRLKAINKAFLDSEKEKFATQQRHRLFSHVEQVWEKNRGGDTVRPEVIVVPPGENRNLIEKERQRGAFIVEYAPRLSESKASPKLSQDEETKIKVLIEVLVAYGLIEGMTYERLQSLIKDINEIFAGE